MSVTDLHKNLAAAIDRVTADHNYTIIAREAGGPAVVLMSLEDFASWQETDYLLPRPENAKRLREAVAELDADKGQVRDLIEWSWRLVKTAGRITFTGKRPIVSGSRKSTPLILECLRAPIHATDKLEPFRGAFALVVAADQPRRPPHLSHDGPRAGDRPMPLPLLTLSGSRA